MRFIVPVTVVVHFVISSAVILAFASRETFAYQLFPRSNQRRSFWKRPYRNLEDGAESLPSRTYQYGVLGSKLRSMTSMVSQRRQKNKEPDIIVEDVESLRNLILDQQKELRQIQIKNYVKETEIQNHEVLKLIAERYETYSTPGNRDDNATLALAMEGGGMRGCVSAGMAAAIASLGLSDAFDTIYGSSAGSVIGAYLISRQMCVDVYVDILPAARRLFVCKRRLVRSIATNLADVVIKRRATSNLGSNSKGTTLTPGMNISYVLDGIMDLDDGLRPLDMKTFMENNKVQKLRVVASSLDEDGNLLSKVFGHDEFFNSTALIQQGGDRTGLFACLQASMTVPGATGPPVKLLDPKSGKVFPCFDAFCFEPIPYRSAVDEGATHVLALCTRPEGFELKTKPGVYEQGVAPLYFNSHRFPEVAKFFEKGGQQFIYAEDLLTLEQGKNSNKKVVVPPPKCFHGVPSTFEHRLDIQERNQNWKQAHLLPLKVGSDVPELATLEQDKDAVLEAVRGGFAAAFDILAPIVGLPDLDGEAVSKAVFPSEEDFLQQQEEILTTKLRVPGQDIPNYHHVLSSLNATAATEEMEEETPRSKRFRMRVWRKLKDLRLRRRRRRFNEEKQEVEVEEAIASAFSPMNRATTTTTLSMERLEDPSDLSQALLSRLPGFNGERGGFHHLSKGLRNQVGDDLLKL